MNLEQIMNETNKEWQLELAKMKLQWEGVKLQAEAAKLEHPELSEQMDAYLELTKNTLMSLLEDLADDEEELEDMMKDAKFIFGEM